MTKRPSLARCLVASALAAPGAFAQGEMPAEAIADWYRVELLVFLREDDAALGAERWDPLPTPGYPESYRFLIDPELADRRLRESQAYASVIDAQGRQQLLLPAPVSVLDPTLRPDALINAPYDIPPETRENDDATGPPSDAGPSDDVLPERSDSEGDAPALTGDDTGDISGDIEPVPTALLALPFQLLDEGALDFRAQARGLRRRGERVVFHGAWWQHLPPDHTPEALVLDRGADEDVDTWPDVQGSVLVYRSRYLHIDVNLWLNTMGSYLPEDWQIDAPPLPMASLDGQALDGSDYNPWAPAPSPMLSGTARAPDLTPGPAGSRNRGALDRLEAQTPGIEMAAEGASEPELVAASEESADSRPVYPWRHAIVHRQSRRMRSEETHYLDHPVIGVIVRLRPAGDDLLPLAGEDERDFRERHGLPIRELAVPDDEGQPADGAP